MPTTGGCLALADSRPSIDAPVVRALKDAGAIILGKTNMHEMALEGLTVSSLGGQTLNPYDLTRTPGGSSGGTGAAVAASFAVLGTGTDTMNSLRSPASANGLFSLRPTRGMVSREGVIPVSHTQDAVGPIARTVEDLTIAMTVMASTGTANSTLKLNQAIDIDNASQTHEDFLYGKRFGLVSGFFNYSPSNETTPVNIAMASTISALKAQGASIIPFPNPAFNPRTILANCDTQRYEYRSQLTSYLSHPTLRGQHPKSFPALYNTSNKNFLIIPTQHAFIRSASISSPQNTSYAHTLHNIATLTAFVKATFAEHALDALLYPEQSNLVVKTGSPSQSGRNGILAAVTGFPVVTVPIGFSPPGTGAPVGVPIGMEVLGLEGTEGDLLRLARVVSVASGAGRRMPRAVEGRVGARRYGKVPEIVPDARGMAREYPIGVF